MAGGGGKGLLWKLLIGGVVVVAAGHALSHLHAGPGWLVPALFAVGGLAVVFASCEAMILSVDGLGARLGWNPFVAGTMGGLASNLPEVVMLGFVLAAEPRVGFIVVMFTLHVGALAFGIYSVLLPRDETGHAKLPAPLVKISTDLFACAGGIFLTTGLIMLAMRLFDAGEHAGLSLDPTDLYVVGVVLLSVEVVAVVRLVQRFSVDDADDTAPDNRPTPDEAPHEAAPGWRAIGAYGALGIVASVVGGHAVGDFADTLVDALTARGYSEMIGALILSVFACAGAYAMAASAHVRGKFDIALAAVSGQVTQVPFVVLPFALILIAAFTQLGVVPAPAAGGALPIDLETTTVVLLGFPPLFILGKAVQDDGKVNWVETASMTAIFAVTIYFLARHG